MDSDYVNRRRDVEKKGEGQMHDMPECKKPLVDAQGFNTPNGPNIAPDRTAKSSRILLDL